MGGESAEERMRHLIKEREPAYSQAHDKIETDRKTAAQVAAEVVRLAQIKAGW
jgi:shikimate kinase